MSDSKLLFRLLHLDLQSAPPQAAVRGITLTATPSYPRAGQASLFTSAATEPARLELMLAKVRKIVRASEQDERVGCAELIDTHKPDAFRIKPFRSEALPAGDDAYRARRTATRIFRPPVPAKVEMGDSKPKRISSTIATGKVVSAAGPWRISGDWWTPTPWARDEWDIALSDGALYRIYFERPAGRWFVEGSYD